MITFDKSIKYLLVISLFLVLNVTDSHSQYGWHQLNSGTTKNLHGVFFYNETFGFVVGEDGTLLRTFNGGLNWSSVSVGVTNDLHKITCLDSLTWIIVGQNGLILRSSDAGSSWSIKSSGTSGNLGHISFISENGVLSDTGFTSGLNGVFIKTTDAGNNWTSYQLNTSQNLYFVKFINKNIGFTGGKGITFKTTNAGVNWIDVSPSNTSELSHCDFKDEYRGIIAGGSNFSQNGVIYRTSNGGINWSAHNTNTGALKFVQYLPNGNILVVGNNAILMSHTDGNIWYPLSSAVTSFFHDAHFINNLTGYGVGNNGVIIKTVSGGIAVGISNLSSEIPASFKLHQNYPNPFNPSTKIKFELPESGNVNLKIYNSIGQEVRTLLNENIHAGVYEYFFDAGTLSSGVYYYKLSTGETSQIMKMILLK